MGGKISAKTGMNFRGNECPVPRLEICLWLYHWFGTKSNQFQISAKSEAKNKLEICLWLCLWFYTDFSSLPNQWQSQRQISSLGTDPFLSLKLFPVLALIWHWWVTSGLNSLQTEFRPPGSWNWGHVRIWRGSKVIRIALQGLVFEIEVILEATLTYYLICSFAPNF